jgi:hypothetical protein
LFSSIITRYKLFIGTKMAEQANELLTLTMSPTDLSVIYKSMEKSIITMQLEFSELEKKATVLKHDIDRQVAMLSVMKSKLEN